MPKSKRRSEAIWMENQQRWQIKVQKDGTRRTFYSTNPSKRGKVEAEKKADDWLEKGAVDMRLDKAWAEFLAYQKNRNGSSNYRGHETAGRLYILKTLGNPRISAISLGKWRSCVDAGADNDLSRRSCINIRQSIIAFVNYAIAQRWDVEPIKSRQITIPTKAAPPIKKKVLQSDALQTLFSESTIQHYGKPKFAHFIYAWRFCVSTGLRRGEVCGLRKTDVKGRALTIRRSINAYREETRGKNDNARRSMKLSILARSVLDEQLAMLASHGIESEWMFPDEFGERAIPNNFYARWDTYRQQHGIDTTIHEMRHTFVSANKADMPLELLKLLVGHSVDMDTTGVYGHEMDGEQDRAADIIDAVFSRLLGMQGDPENPNGL